MGKRTIRNSLSTLALALVGGMLVAPPAEADHARPGDHVAGHRCRTYDRAVSNENTPVALADTAEGLPGAICEIDTMTLADGTIIVWHDVDWRRVADPNTLPAGISPDDRVVNATWEQVRLIRTRGGEPVARLEDMIDASVQYDIPLWVDIRRRIRPATATRLVQYADNVGADVSYYQLIPNDCNTRNIDPFRAAGAKVGIKILRACTTITPAELAAKGVTFTQQLSFALTDSYIAAMTNAGISVGTLNKGMTQLAAEALIDRGVSRVLLDRPRDAVNWFN